MGIFDYDSFGNLLFLTVNNPDKNTRLLNEKNKVYRHTCTIPGNLMNEGDYYVNALITTREKRIQHVFEENVITFQVVDMMKPDGARGDLFVGNIPGAIRPKLEWQVDIIN